MSQISFKQYSEIVDEATSEERLNEIFGLFKNNEKVKKLRQDREKLLAAKKAAMKKRDDAWKKAKDEVENRNGGFDPLERGSGTMRSQQAVGRAAERDWVSGMVGESVLAEGVTMRHDHGALVTALDHFGSQAENPEAYRDLVQGLKILNLKVPQDKVWAYDADGFADIFERVSRKMKVQNPDAPDLNDFLRAGFERVKKFRGTVFLKKGNVVAMLDDSSEGVPTTYLVGGKELDTGAAQ